MEEILYCILILLALSSGTHRDIQMRCPVEERGLDIIVDCPSKQLFIVPRHLPKSATIINLSNNSIQAIFDTPFNGMLMLRELDLSDNHLSFIPLNLFKGLFNLRKLSLRNSRLNFLRNFVLDTLLSDQLHLNYFSLTFQITFFRPPLPCRLKHSSQPFGSVNSLQHVDTLEIDSAFLRWQTNLSQLVYTTKTMHVINGFVCYYDKLGKGQFEYMPFLENLSISMPFFISGISDDIVKSQTRLKHLAIYGLGEPNGNAKDLIHNVSYSVFGLHNLSTLVLNNFSNKIQSQFFCNLTYLVQLTSLSLAGNSLSLAFAGLQLPVSLKHLSIQGNCLILYHILYNILFLNEQIEIVDASDQSKCALLRSGRSVADSENKYDYNVYMLKKLIFTNSSDRIFFRYNNDYFPHLSYLDLSLNNKVSRNEIPYSFSSRRPFLQSLNLSLCNIYHADDYSFSYFNKLEYLDLSRNMLGSMQDKLGTWFANLTSLKELNISSNNIKQIPSDFFDFMSNIDRIDLSRNKLNNFEIWFPIEKLSYLDLSNNRLEKLSENTRNILDILAYRNSIKVGLSGNILLCTCETLDFLQWMKDTKVNLLRKDQYDCSYSNGTRTSLRNIRHIVKHLRSDCASKTVFIVTISSVTAFGLLSICTIFAHKFRWKIRYFNYKTKIKIPYRRTGHGYEQIYAFDVFVSYSTEDHKVARQDTIFELETKRNFRACIHERDFTAGESIAYNISKGIRSSKRTILFLSSSFLASEWCMYELNIARMESLHTGRKVILVVFLENIPNKSLPIDVLDIIDTYTYLEYPKHGTRGDIDVFWSKCEDFIS